MDYSAAAGKTVSVQTFLDRYGHSALTISASEPVVDASKHFSEAVEGNKYSIAVVLDDSEKVVGVLSLTDVVFAIHRHRDNIFKLKVADIMSTRVHAARLTDDILSLLKHMAEVDIRHMPVVEDGTLLGLVTRKDALEGLYDEAALELKSLNEFVFKSGARC